MTCQNHAAITDVGGDDGCVFCALEAENGRLRAEAESLRLQQHGGPFCLTPEQMKHSLDRTGALEDSLASAMLQVGDLRRALSALVREVEDTWHHHGRCLIGTDLEKPETECECGPGLEEQLEVLSRVPPGPAGVCAIVDAARTFIAAEKASGNASLRFGMDCLLDDLRKAVEAHEAAHDERRPG